MLKYVCCDPSLCVFFVYSSIFANAISILFVKYNTNEDSIDLYAGATMLDLVFDWHKLTVEGNKVFGRLYYSLEILVSSQNLCTLYKD